MMGSDITVVAAMSNIPLAFALVMGSIMLLTGLLLMITGFVTVRQWRAARKWPLVPARIISSTVSQESCFEDRIMYKPEISYTFLTPGGQFTGKGIGFVGRLYETPGQAAKEIKNYPPGMTVKVRYNPEQPDQAVLIRRGGLAGLLLMLFGLSIIVVLLSAAHFAGLPAWQTGLVLTAVVALGAAFSRWISVGLSRARRSGLYPPPGKGSDRDVERLIMHGEKMLAIRLYRELHGTDMKTARLRVEDLMTRVPGK